MASRMVRMSDAGPRVRMASFNGTQYDIKTRVPKMVVTYISLLEKVGSDAERISS